MIKNFCGILVAACLLVTAAYSYNDKLLDSEADTYTSKICSGVAIRKDKVRDSLDFLQAGDVVDPKYSQTSFYEQITAQVKDAKFAKFAEVCKGIYDESDAVTKIATNLLLERVAGKYQDFLKKSQQLKAPSTQSSDNAPSMGTVQLVDIFATADKSINLH